MLEYAPPLTDIRFVLDHVAGLAELLGHDAFTQLDPATVHGVVEEAARFFADVVAPLNQIGDVEGAELQDDGRIHLPKGFHDAYDQMVEAGWVAVPFDPAYGGGGFPELVGIVLQELLITANLSFSMCPLLTQGAIHALDLHGSEELKETYLRKLVTGEWAGTMNLTEPEAGSDVGALRTKAAPAGDGTWRISGQKIYISFGEHELTENIVHLVLARTPGAPPGTKGISCFVVPKYLVNPDGSLGERNDVRCVSIEHKMGIKASPTCVLSYGDAGGAVGYLIGEENQGMRYMFTMMNSARLGVGVQGLGLGERAWQAASRYALERRQGRAPGAPAGESSLIVEHPDVRRMLLTMKAEVEAMRALIYLNAAAADHSRHHPDPDERQRASDLNELLIPITKAWSTDLGVEVTSHAIQVYGGMGYIEETGVAQYYRDARIAPIYEGTNGIQAMDLVGRKLPMRGGAPITDLVGRIRATVHDLEAAGGELAGLAAPLAAATDELESCVRWLREEAAADPRDALAGATPFLRLCGLVVGSWLLDRSALAAEQLRGTGEFDDDWLAAKVVTARFYTEHLLPGVHGLVGAITAGAATLLAAPPVAFQA